MRKRIILGLTTVLFLAVVLYLAGGYLVYTQLGDVRDNCDWHRANCRITLPISASGRH